MVLSQLLLLQSLYHITDFFFLIWSKPQHFAINSLVAYQQYFSHVGAQNNQNLTQFLSVPLLLQIHFRYCSCLLPCTSTFFLSPPCSAAAQRGPWPPHVWGFLITHNDTPQSVGLLWMSDQLITETSTWQHTTLTTERNPCPRRDSKPRPQTYELDCAATGTNTSANLLLTNVLYTTSHHPHCKAVVKKNSVHCNSHTVCME